jgi:hypothetical protein
MHLPGAQQEQAIAPTASDIRWQTRKTFLPPRGRFFTKVSTPRCPFSCMATMAPMIGQPDEAVARHLVGHCDARIEDRSACTTLPNTMTTMATRQATTPNSSVLKKSLQVSSYVSRYPEAVPRRLSSVVGGHLAQAGQAFARGRQHELDVLAQHHQSISMIAFSARSGWRAITASSTARCRGKELLGPSGREVDISKLVRSSALSALLICTSMRLRQARSRPWWKRRSWVT